jgi:hypothetical protein
MSDPKDLKDEQLDEVSGGARSITNPGIMHPKPVSATGEGEINPDFRIPGGGHEGGGISHTPQ